MVAYSVVSMAETRDVTKAGYSDVEKVESRAYRWVEQLVARMVVAMVVLTVG